MIALAYIALGLLIVLWLDEPLIGWSLIGLAIAGLLLTLGLRLREVRQERDELRARREVRREATAERARQMLRGRSD